MNKSKEFFQSAFFLFAPAIAMNMTSCVSTETYRQESVQGEASILDWSGWGSGDVFEIDGDILTNHNRAELKPGRHNIRYGGEIGTSFLLNPKMSDSYDFSTSVDMMPGHIYKVMHKRTYGYASYRDYFWIEDTLTGEVVAGNYPGY